MTTKLVVRTIFKLRINYYYFLPWNIVEDGGDVLKYFGSIIVGIHFTQSLENLEKKYPSTKDKEG